MDEYQSIDASEAVDVKLPKRRGKTLLEQMMEDGPLPPTEADKELLQKMTEESTGSLEE